VAWIAFKPLSPWVFRVPSPLEPGVHGPGVSRGSLTYPPPSTIAGFLASTAYSRGLCSGLSQLDWQDYRDVEECLERLGSGSYNLRPGLALTPSGRIAAYIGGPKLALLDELHAALKDIARAYSSRRCPLGDVVKGLMGYVAGWGWGPGRSVLTGIALDRASKTVVEGMLYSVERVDWRGGEVLVYVEGVQLQAPVTGRFGGEGGMAHAAPSSEPRESYVELASRGEGSRAAVALITPALLEESPLSGTVNPFDRRAAERLAEELFSSFNCVGAAETVYVPKRGDLPLQVVFPGWSLAGNSPRSPHLMVPAGTVAVVEAERSCLERAAREGVGSHSRLGWGSIVFHAVEGRR